MSQVGQPGMGTPGAPTFPSVVGATLGNSTPVPVTVSVGRNLTVADDGKVLDIITALTLVVPVGLSPRPNVVFILPPTGNLSIAPSGGALLNGATATLTRSRATNPAGVVLTPYTESDGYGVSGS